MEILDPADSIQACSNENFADSTQSWRADQIPRNLQNCAMPHAPDDDRPPLAQARSRLLEQVRLNVRRVSPPPEPTSDGTWPDLDVAEPRPSNWAGREFLLRVEALAAHGRANAALKALDWWLRRDPLNPNWWHNQIGTPRLVGGTLVLLGDRVSPELLAACRPILERSGDFLLSTDGLTRTPSAWTGANLLWMSINRLIAALLFGETDTLADAVSAAMREVFVASSGQEGMQVDGSFHQHGPLLYNGGYGRAFLNDCAFIIAATLGTPWAPAEETRRLLVDHLLDGTRWMLRGAEVMPACRDRNITRDLREPANDLANVADILAAAGAHRREELSALSISIRRETAPGSLAGNRMFYRSDFMVQHSPAACVAVRMHSVRTKRAESINGEGLRSHHLADGLTWLLRSGAEYRDIYPVWDWQRLPGITCALTPEPEPPGEVDRPSPTVAVGGVSDGNWGACTQHLVNDRLSIRKSWFFGPGKLVCLGAGLRAETGLPVVTTLDQSLLQGPVTVNEAHAPLTVGRHALKHVHRLDHGPWGFEFPAPVDVFVEIGPRTGRWSDIGSGSEKSVTQDVFLAHLAHGSDGTPDGYAYAVRLGDDRCGYEILENSPQVQAVRWPHAGLSQVVFHEPGRFSLGAGNELSVDRPCCVQIAGDESQGWRLTLADHTQKAELITVALSGPDGSPMMNARTKPPDGDQAGKSFLIRPDADTDPAKEWH